MVRFRSMISGATYCRYASSGQVSRRGSARRRRRQEDRIARSRGPPLHRRPLPSPTAFPTVSAHRTMSDYLAELEQRRARALEMGGPDKIARQHARGRLTARERIEGLVDAGSFIEFGLLAHSDIPEAEDEEPGGWQGMRRGPHRRSHDRSQRDRRHRVCGAQGRVGSRKVHWLAELAFDKGYPLVLARRGRRCAHSRHPRIRRHCFLLLVTRHLSEPPAARTDGDRGSRRRLRRDRVGCGVFRFRGAAQGHVHGRVQPARARSGDERARNRGGARRLGAPCQKDRGSSTAPSKRRRSASRRCAGSSRTCRRTIKRCRRAWHGDPEAAARQERLEQILPVEPRRGYSMHKVLEVLFDRDSLFELKPLLDRSAITALARLDGAPVGVIASNPMQARGAWARTPATRSPA